MEQKPFTEDSQSMFFQETYSSNPIEGDIQSPQNDQPCALAESFLAQAEIYLLKGEAKGLPLLETAAKLDPNNARLFFRQGLSLVEYGSTRDDKKILLLACKKFKRATVLDPTMFEAWSAWGDALLELGNLTELHHYFTEAKEKLEKAISLSHGKPIDNLVDLHWKYALTWRSLADQSGEALDLHQAFEAFQKAANLHENSSHDFWIDFGLTCYDLAALVNDAKLYVKAVFCYKQAVSLHSDNEEAWELLAKTFYTLYKITHDEDQFSQAGDCFSIATKIKPEKAQIWIDWADFLVYSGKMTSDLRRLRSAIDKCEKAATLEPNDVSLAIMQCQALSALGEFSENLELLVEAEEKILQIIDSEDHDPEVWHAYGNCLYGFGKYFQDVDYFEQSIEKFQSGLSIDRTMHALWHGMAKSYESIALMLVEQESFAKACRFYIKAIELSPSSYYVYDFALLLSKFGELTHNQSYLQQSIAQFEFALQMQKNALYTHADWLFHYASTLDMLGDFFEDPTYYSKAIDILQHVLMLNPDFPQIHHRLALAYSHLGDLSEEVDHFYRALHHYRIAAKREEENDFILLDWGTTLISAGKNSADASETEVLFKDAENMLLQSAKLGNAQAYYPLACLSSTQGNFDKAFQLLQKGRSLGGLPPHDELLQDEWLDEFRLSPLYKEFLSEIEKQTPQAEEK